MSKNIVILSEDRINANVISATGERLSVKSELPGGFTDSHVAYMESVELRGKLSPGEKRVVRKFNVFGKPVYVHVNTGPPTWWIPRVEVNPRKREIMVGWIRGLVAVSIGEK